MKTRLVIFLVVAVITLTLSACASSATEPASTLSPIVENPVIPSTPTLSFSCSAFSAEPTSIPDSASLFPPVTSTDFSIGPADAAVTIVAYCDYQTEGCREMASVLRRLASEHDDLRLVFRPLPLIGVTDKAERPVLAVLAADEQGKFWEMHNLLFTKHVEWSTLSPADFDGWLTREVVNAGMDAEQLQAAMNAEGTANRLKSMYEAARLLAIPAVPLVLVNGAIQPSYVLDYQNMSDTVGLIMLGTKQFTECPPFEIDPARQYLATIETEKGNIVIELLPNKAPLAVNSFVFLARQGWYDGVTFHRVIPGFVAQAGDPSGTGRGNPGYFFHNEISNLLFDAPGLVGMANSGPDTNGSQFFITFAPAQHLDGVYTIFGRVLSGLDVAEQLTPRDPSQGTSLPTGDRIITIKIEEK
jgi:cyclophilin family peptidyl-prolyl cis-trans isomerase/protein-disulfide isomerase